MTAHTRNWPIVARTYWPRLILVAALLLALVAATRGPAAAAEELTATSAAISYGTYVGGASDDVGQAVAVDHQGNVIITGYTYSAQIPGTTGTRSDQQLFITKLNPSGSAVIFSQVIGGADDEEGRGVAVDGQGNIWVTGATESQNFPTSGALAGSYQGGNSDTFVMKLSPAGAILLSALIGDESSDQGNGIAVDPQGNAYVAAESGARFGPVAMVAKIAAAGDQIVYRGYFGEADHGFDRGTLPRAIAVNATGQAFIVGRTNTPAFLTPNGLYTQCGDFDRTGGECDYADAFLTVISADGTSIIYGSYLGGTISDEATGVALGADESIYITGTTFADNFPVRDASQGQKVGPDNFADGFLTRISPNGDALVFSTYYAGDKWDEPATVAVDGQGNAYIAGLTSSNDLPVPGAAQSEIRGICITGSTERWCYDGFVAAFSAGGALSWATYLGGTFDDSVKGISIGPDGGVIVGGRAESHNFPTTNGTLQPVKALADDAFVMKLGGSGGSGGGNPNLPYRVALPLVSR